MAFAPHSRVSFGGKLLSVGASTYDEQWQCNVSVIDGSTGTAFDNGAYLAQMAPNLKTWFADTASGISSGATLEWVKCNAINPDGSYFDKNNTNVFDYPGDFANGGRAPVNPNIISIATSWGTAKGRGPGSKGRIYLPNPTYATGNSMTITPVDALAAANAGKALLAVLRNIPGAVPVECVIASKVNATNTPITRVSVGSVKDVQRRRKNALVETYTTISAN